MALYQRLDQAGLCRIGGDKMVWPSENGIVFLEFYENTHGRPRPR